MGRFEKRPDNPQVRGELSRAAETALWAVVEDLESLQRNMLKSLQDEIKQLQAQKSRLSDDIQQLLEEKEHLQQVRQITEQQVLIRQLSEALAKHISSQLQSSLANLTSQSSGGNSQLKSVGNQNENTEQMLGSLDDTLTITFNSLQQEIKNYQTTLSQQLSRMQSQQQQGEAIVEELINHLQGELVKATKEISLKATTSSPTVLQPTEPYQPSSPQTYLQVGEIQSSTENLSQSNNTLSGNVLPFSNPNTNEPTSVISREVSQPDTESPESGRIIESISIFPGNVAEDDRQSPPEPTSVINREDWEDDRQSPPEPTSVISREDWEDDRQSPPEPTSVISREDWEDDRQSPSEPTSVINREDWESDRQFTSSPNIPPETTSVINRRDWEDDRQSPSQPETPPEPISVLSREDVRRDRRSPSQPISPQSPSSSKISSIQIGFLLVVLSAVVSSLYNVAIKGMFFKAYDNLGVLEIQGLISPTLGNIFLILTLRLLVVVPLMILLAPMMHPQVWQDMQNLVTSTRGSSTSNSSLKTQKFLQLSIASGCFLFVSQVLIYLAISQVATGMAIALFFVYPIVSGIFSWLLFRDQPTGFRAAAIGAIFCGELLVIGGSAGIGTANFILGISTAILAGVAFACYVILTRVCAAKIHPVSFTLINFSTMFILSFIGLMLPLPRDLSLAVDQSKLLELVLSAFILGVLTLVGYVLNNVGIRKLGALRSAIIGAGVPILTVVFAGLILQETLAIMQIMGVLFVTFGVAAYSFEKMRTQVKTSSSET
ncbi:EamA family transporter [Nostoc sp. CCY0012]|uniref:EamA family transporter n=1 Tax=Nostoc sp. CCY0012 TaxID=1056123 RepID=UPI0039C72C0E